MTTDTSKRIVEYIRSKKQATANELIGHFSISNRAIFKQLKKLTEKGLLTKIGKPPKVFYMLAEAKVQKGESPDSSIIEENYLTITPTGEKKSGMEGFMYWCQRNCLDIRKTVKEYEKTFKKYHAYMRNGLIDGIEKMKKTFDRVHFSHVFYLDFYSIERFGKTKLGQLLLYAKQSQNKEFIKELTKTIKPKIDDLIKKHKIDAVGFIPPTIKREVQFMKELEKHLDLKAKKISIVKIKTPVIVAQKTLNKLDDRIINAQTTIIVDEKKSYKNILLIDDAVGSGATLNETAGQIKEKKIGKSIIGLAITGSFKGFDVISEV